MKPLQLTPPTTFNPPFSILTPLVVLMNSLGAAAVLAVIRVTCCSSWPQISTFWMAGKVAHAETFWPTDAGTPLIRSWFPGPAVRTQLSDGAAFSVICSLDISVMSPFSVIRFGMVAAIAERPVAVTLPTSMVAALISLLWIAVLVRFGIVAAIAERPVAVTKPALIAVADTS